MPEFPIRFAVPDDAEQIMLLRKRLNADPSNKNPPLDPYGGNYPTVEQQQSEIRDYTENSIFLVALNGPQIVGIAFCFEIYGRPGEYKVNFSVDKAWRRKGIGSALLTRVAEWAKESPNIQKLICSFHQSHKDAAQVCKKLGFEVTKKGFAYFIQAYRYRETEMTLSVR